MRIALALVLVAACGDGPGGNATRGNPTLEAFERRMCSCRDAACAKLVVGELAAWSKRIPDTAAKPDPAASAAIMARINACMTRASAPK